MKMGIVLVMYVNRVAFFGALLWGVVGCSHVVMIVDGNDQPVSGAIVSAREFSMIFPWGCRNSLYKTDANGQVALRESGGIYFQVGKVGYWPVTWQKSVREIPEKISLTPVTKVDYRGFGLIPVHDGNPESLQEEWDQYTQWLTPIILKRRENPY